MTGNLWFLKRCGLFEDLSPAQAARLDAVSSVRTFPKKSMVYAPTEPGRSVLVLAQGRVKIKDITPEGKESILAFIEEGELFGELALFDDRPRREYAEAILDSKVLLIPREEVLNLMAERPDLTLSISKLIGLRRRRIENRLRNVLFMPVRERLCRLLLELLEVYGQREGNHYRLKLSMSHQDLAGLIGVTRETVTLALGELQADGIVRVARRALTVLDADRLFAESQEIGEVPRPVPREVRMPEPVPAEPVS
jgi:CRP-like cAMP-binding protein